MREKQSRLETGPLTKEDAQALEARRRELLQARDQIDRELAEISKKIKAHFDYLMKVADDDKKEKSK